MLPGEKADRNDAVGKQGEKEMKIQIKISATLASCMVEEDYTGLSGYTGQFQDNEFLEPSMTEEQVAGWKGLPNRGQKLIRVLAGSTSCLEWDHDNLLFTFEGSRGSLLANYETLIEGREEVEVVEYESMAPQLDWWETYSSTATDPYKKNKFKEVLASGAQVPLKNFHQNDVHRVALMQWWEHHTGIKVDEECGRPWIEDHSNTPTDVDDPYVCLTALHFGNTEFRHAVEAGGTEEEISATLSFIEVLLFRQWLSVTRKTWDQHVQTAAR